MSRPRSRRRSEQEHGHARRLRYGLAIPFTVAVDDVDGSFHRSLDPKPNTAYLMDADTTILFRSQTAPAVTLTARPHPIPCTPDLDRQEPTWPAPHGTDA